MAIQPAHDEGVKSSALDYETPPQPTKRPFFTPAGWFLLAGCCAFVEFAGWFATGGRINGWGDIAFIVGFAVFGFSSLAEGFRSARRRAKAE